MQLAWSRIWTRFTVSISYDDNHYTTGTSHTYSLFLWLNLILILLFIHPYTHSSFYSPAYSLFFSLTHILTLPFTHPQTHSSFYSPVYSLFLSLNHFWNCSCFCAMFSLFFMLSTLLFIYLFINSSINVFHMHQSIIVFSLKGVWPDRQHIIITQYIGFQ